MTMEEAEERLQQDSIKMESYLVRFSESLTDKGTSFFEGVVCL